MDNRYTKRIQRDNAADTPVGEFLLETLRFMGALFVAGAIVAVIFTTRIGVEHWFGM